MTPHDVAVALAGRVVDEDAAFAVDHVLAWAHAVWGAGVDEAPLVLLHDLGFVLWRGRGVRLCAGVDRAAVDVDGVNVDGAEVANVGDGAAALRAARLAYEDRVVAPWLNDPGLMAAHVVIAGLSDDARARALPHALALALGRALPPGSFASQNAGAARSLRQRDGGAIDVDAVSDVDAAAAAVVVDAVRGALAGRTWFSAEDVWEIEHLEDIPAEATRLALRTVHRLVATLGPADPSVLARLHRRQRDVPVDADDTSAFPAGGFDAMSTRGTFENLVRSEVAYVGEGRGVDVDGRPTGPDLFDLRFVESELLYYTRDETPLLEERRAAVFVIDEVERLRVKLPELVSQSLVIVLALCMRAHHDLVHALGPLATHTTFALSGAEDVVDEELGLLRLSLAADVAHRRVALVALADAPRRGRVVFSPRAAPAKSDKAAWRAVRLWVRVGARFVVTDAGVDGDVVVDAADLSALRRFVDRLLLTL